MKHNEFKAFFKKRLVDKLCLGYEVLSIDETLSSRNIYILEKETLIAKVLVKCWFATNNYSISIFKIDESNNKELNIYKDYVNRFEGSYNQTSLMEKAIHCIYDCILED